jgi:hypothetical protein
LVEVDGLMLELGFNSAVDQVEIDFECAVTAVLTELLARGSLHLIVAKIVVLVKVPFRSSLITRFWLRNVLIGSFLLIPPLKIRIIMIS